MSATQQETKTVITLKGSTEIVVEYFGTVIPFDECGHFGIITANSILYQRGIYPPEDFTKTSKYGLSLFVSKDDGLKKYLKDVLDQLSSWLMKGDVQKLVLVITSASTKEVLERWAFDIQAEATVEGKAPEKPVKQIMSEIQSIMRQITSTVSFLPLLMESCTFDLLVYTNADISVPQAWEESDPKYIQNSQEVRLRSFTTKVHKIDTSVSYKIDE